MGKIPFNYIHYIAYKYTIQEVFGNMAIFAFDTIVKDPATGRNVEFGSLSTASQQQILAADESASDASLGASFQAYKATTGTTNYDIATSGYIAGPVNSAGGSYSTEQGYVPVTRDAPSFAGGYYGDQVERGGGGYDPRNIEPYTQAPDFNATTTWTGGGYDPDAQAGGYDPTTGYVQGAGNSIGGQAAITETYMGGKDIYAGGYYGEQTEEGGGGYDPSVQGLNDPKNARLAVAGINAGGYAGAPAQEPSVSFSTEPDTGNADMEKDWRVRISLSERARFFYNAVEGNALLAPLKKTNGVIFPYTPSITVSHIANYSSTNPTHSNYSQNFYNNSDVSDITITGDFTVQNIDEGKYLMAAIYFFRSATKMFFGQGDGVGNPPPIVFLDGYGSHYFPHVPCVITNFSHTLTPDVDYIEIPMASKTLTTTQNNTNWQTQDRLPGPRQPALSQSINEITRVPTASSISITLKPQYSRRNLHDRFDLTKFAAGELLRDKTGGYGGFL